MGSSEGEFDIAGSDVSSGKSSVLDGVGLCSSFTVSTGDFAPGTSESLCGDPRDEISGECSCVDEESGVGSTGSEECRGAGLVGSGSWRLGKLGC